MVRRFSRRMQKARTMVDRARSYPVREGVHYTVLASTMWGDYHQPTVVRWEHGPTDSFQDLEESLANRAAAIEAVDA